MKLNEFLIINDLGLSIINDVNDGDYIARIIDLGAQDFVQLVACRNDKEYPIFAKNGDLESSVKKLIENVMNHKKEGCTCMLTNPPGGPGKQINFPLGLEL
jgi:hypothetical protein